MKILDLKTNDLGTLLNNLSNNGINHKVGNYTITIFLINTVLEFDKEDGEDLFDSYLKKIDVEILKNPSIEMELKTLSIIHNIKKEIIRLGKDNPYYISTTNLDVKVELIDNTLYVDNTFSFYLNDLFLLSILDKLKEITIN